MILVTSNYPYGAAADISSVVWDPAGDNQTLSLVAAQTHSAVNRKSALYYLAAPTSAKTGTVRVTISSTAADRVVDLHCRHVTGHDTTSMIRNSTSRIESAPETNDLPITITSQADDLVVAFASVRDTYARLGAGDSSNYVEAPTDGTVPVLMSGTKPGAASVTCTFAYDYTTHFDNSIFAVSVAPASASATITLTGTIPTQNATEGTPFSVDLSTYFSGTETPFTYAVQSGTLPTGLTLNSSTGEITGTPTTPGTASGIVIRATDGNLDTADSNSFSIDVAASDTTAPVLTSPTGTATGETTASGTVSTDEANGTLYYLATTNSTESAATVKGGSSQAVTATGSQSVSVTGLTAGTGYYLHYVHRDAAGNDSTVASSALFTTDAVPVAVPGVRIQLHDGATEQASLTGLTVAWFDDDDPATMGAPVLQSSTEATDASGWLEVDLDGYTALDVGDPGFLIVYKAGATAPDDIVFAGRLVIEDIG